MQGTWESPASLAGSVRVTAKTDDLIVAVTSAPSTSSYGPPLSATSINTFSMYDAGDFVEQEIGTESYRVASTRYPSDVYLFSLTGTSSLHCQYPVRSGLATASLSKQPQ